MGKFYIMMGALAIALFGLLGVSVLLAQEIDSKHKLDKSVTQLRPATAKSNAAKQKILATQDVTPAKRKNISVKIGRASCRERVLRRV